jgi:hypothetical protein
MHAFCVGGVGSSVNFDRAGRVWVKVVVKPLWTHLVTAGESMLSKHTYRPTFSRLLFSAASRRVA